MGDEWRTHAIEAAEEKLHHFGYVGHASVAAICVDAAAPIIRADERQRTTISMRDLVPIVERQRRSAGRARRPRRSRRFQR